MNDIDVLMAIEDIRRLEARYARYADGKRWTDLANLFTEDGTFTPLDTDGNPMASMIGRDGIDERLNASNSGDVTPIHQLLTHEIDILTPTTAKAIWAMGDMIFRGDDAVPPAGASGNIPPFRTMVGFGHYHVTYKKLDGTWYIATRTLTRTRLEFTY